MFKHLLVLSAGTLLAGCVLTTDDTSTNSDSNSNTNATSGNTDPGTDTGGTTVENPTTGATDSGTTSISTSIGTTTDAPTTDAPTTEATTTEGTTSNTTGPVDPGCGWNSRDKYYACAPAGVPGLEDPDGISPISCADGLVAGEKCTEMDGPVDGIGCCTPEGTLFYCNSMENGGDNTIVFEDCNA